MTEYALAVFAVCLAVSLLGLLCYKDGKSEKIALGIIALYVIISPVAKAAVKFDPDSIIQWIPPDTEESDGGYIKIAEEAFAKGILAAVTERFSFKEENVTVELSGFDFDKMSAESIEITLSGVAALADCRAVEKYINDMDIGECKVEIKIG